ncbi:MAG: hypothetical protein ACTH31_04665 [Pseudoclavibacter sp.]
MEAPIEREFKAASHVRVYLLAILVCVLIGFAGTTIAMISGVVTGAVFISAFAAIPLVICVFLAVRDSATTPSVIVSDRGLERSNADRTVVIRWRYIAAVDVLHNERTSIRYLTSDRLEALTEERLAGGGGEAEARAVFSETNGNGASGTPGSGATKRGLNGGTGTNGNGDESGRDGDDDPVAVADEGVTLDTYDVERVIRLELDIIDDLPAVGEAMPEIPSSRAGEAALAWDALLKYYAGERYKGIRTS